MLRKLLTLLKESFVGIVQRNVRSLGDWWRWWRPRAWAMVVSDARYILWCIIDPRYILIFYLVHRHGFVRIQFTFFTLLICCQSIKDYGWINPLQYPDFPYILLMLVGAYLWHWFRGRRTGEEV